MTAGGGKLLTKDCQPAAGGFQPATASFDSARTRRRVTQVILYTLLIIGAIIALFPMLWMISASFMPTGEASQYPPHLLPSRITFSHYAELLDRKSVV